MDIIFDGRLRYADGTVTENLSGGGLSFVSSAEIAGAWRFVKPVCSELTASLLGVVRREFRPLVLPFGHHINIGSARVAILQAGPIPGAAALLLEEEGRKVLFCSGNPRDPGSLPRCDMLILTVTSESPRPEVEVLTDIVESARSAVKSGMVPVVRCNPSGVARPVCAALASSGLRVRVHKGVARFNRVWRVHGYDTGLATEFRGGEAAGSVVVMPSHIGRSPLEDRIPHPWRINVARAGGESVAGSVSDQSMLMPGVLTVAEAVRLVSVSRPDVVCLSGDGAGRCATMLASETCRVTVVDSNRQVSLL